MLARSVTSAYRCGSNHCTTQSLGPVRPGAPRTPSRAVAARVLKTLASAVAASLALRLSLSYKLLPQVAAFVAPDARYRPRPPHPLLRPAFFQGHTRSPSHPP